MKIECVCMLPRRQDSGNERERACLSVKERERERERNVKREHTAFRVAVGADICSLGPAITNEPDRKKFDRSKFFRLPGSSRNNDPQDLDFGGHHLVSILVDFERGSEVRR